MEKVFLLQIDKKSTFDNSEFIGYRHEVGKSPNALIEFIKKWYKIDELLKNAEDDFPYFTDGGFLYKAVTQSWIYTFICYPVDIHFESPTYITGTEDGI